jgi:hypothetical protein
MGAQKGKDLLVKMYDGASYVTVAGLRSRKIAFNAELVDVTHAESVDRWRELLAGAGVKRASLSGRGLFRRQQHHGADRDTGSIANATWYHVHFIKRPDTGAVDMLISLSATAPTLPTNYTLSRRIGAMKTDGSAKWMKFVQDGDTFMWDVPASDFIGQSNPGTSAILRALSVPPGINVTAIFHARCYTTTLASAVATLFTDPAATDTAPDFNNAQQIGNTTLSPFANLRIRTDTSRHIRVRSSFSDSGVGFTLATDGWVDPRGK